MRTDVGGIYRRIASPTSPGGYLWHPLLDWAGPSNASFYSANALAVDPQDGNTLFIATGPYWSYSNCSVLYSHDGGETWTMSPASNGWGLRCGGNENNRNVGDRLAVHPQQRGTLAVGGADGHVYIATDGFVGAVPPARVDLPSPAASGDCNPDKNASCVVLSVLWLPLNGSAASSAKEGGKAAAAAEAASVVLLVAAVPSLGLFASPGPDYADASLWSFVEGSGGPDTINRITQLSFSEVPSSGGGGRIWATCQKGGIWSGIISPGGGGWSIAWDITGVLGGEGIAFSGIALVPGSVGGGVFALSLDFSSNTSLWSSTDGGVSFTQRPWNVTSAVPWWGSYSLALNAACSLAFDPTAPLAAPQLWVTDFFGAYVSTVPPSSSSSSSSSTAAAAAATATASAPLQFQSVETGHEEVCMNVIRDPPQGYLLTGAADVGGWAHDNGASAWPSTTFKAADGWAHNCLFGIDYTLSLSPGNETADAVWVTAGDEYGSCHGSPSWCGLHSWVGVSRDGGATFIDTNWDSIYAVDQANPYRVAVHPFNGAIALVAARTGLPLSYTRDYGTTWGNSTGGVQSVGLQGNFWFATPLAVERNGPSNAPEATFYYYNGTTTLFTSTDSGASFTITYSSFPTWQVPFFGLATPPRGTSTEGDLWIFAGWQLLHSTNGGVNVTGIYSLAHLDGTLAIGALPPTVSARTGRDQAALAALCVQRRAAEAAAAGRAALSIPQSEGPQAAPPPAYVVYVVGEHLVWNAPQNLYASIDFGHSWITLAGVNATPTQGLGDTPLVLEASAKSPGVLYVGTGGRGAFWRDVSADLQEALLQCEQE